MEYAALVDELGSIRELMAHLEQREAEIRGRLITQCGSSTNVRCEGTRSVVFIRVSPRLKLPQMGSNDRATLQRLIAENDAWSEVSNINGRMLCKAISRHRFEAPDAKVISAICPRVCSHTLIVRPIVG